MKPFDSRQCKLLAARELSPGIFDFTVSCPELAALAVPGQFAQILVPGHTLRRPISICSIGRETLRFVFQVRGEGTEKLSRYRPGDDIDILAPLGKGFPIDPNKRTILVGGGIGVPPLLGVAEALGGNAVAVLGFRSRGLVILEEDFKNTGAKVLIATDDGSYGYHGLVTDLAAGEDFQVLMACGPGPMLRGAGALAGERGVPGYLSLEQRMACGVGACLGCAVALTDGEGREYFGHVCKDGPVFPMDRLKEV
ncbi:MAG: dihydroorotate dehydrogenase electron transfer subunit [Acutalibacter sp.]|jgi:dihydroorotate dehydrogenase electron transfer subunit|uniref:dihydroorotate dehydrogenase electron transfer subunit n=1 Tax=Acutalibacter sp. TaxID=1918636 RepID=UPI00216F4CD9|nr:dihydroorotate dehydrogenase electron transfer subunit [Acutalibacter sp.]MCI9224344.1 dihydroorotate dehydrogenase electron transfer subunit [Acutalibacter sp.]